MPMEVIDIQDNGLGDVVVACWLASSAKAANRSVFLNPRRHRDVALLLGVDQGSLTEDTGPNWSQTESIGHQYEYAIARSGAIGRFDAWSKALGLYPLEPIRPNYFEAESDRSWAKDQWTKVDPSFSRPRALLFPDAAWRVRQWPPIFFAALASMLSFRGFAVAAMAAKNTHLGALGCWHWWGFPLSRVAAMIRQSDLVIANDSGPAHLAGTIGTNTFAICGPTTREVFAHDRNVRALSLSRDEFECVGCYFAPNLGFARRCGQLGCEALHRLTPERVCEQVRLLFRID